MTELRIKVGTEQSEKLVMFALFAILLSSCSTFIERNWPDSAPPKQYFMDAYSADVDNRQLQSQVEYLRWISSFYRGNLAYQSGWLDIQTAMLSRSGLEQRYQLASQLEIIGAKIGAEWAKHNNVRLIDNRILSLWGSALQLAEGVNQRSQSLEMISTDLDNLLAGQLHKGDIVELRYSEFLQWEDFGDF